MLLLGPFLLITGTFLLLSFCPILLYMHHALHGPPPEHVRLFPSSLAVLVHEIAHIVMARKRGQEPQSILLWPLGGFNFVARGIGCEPKDDLFIALAGPLSHIPMGLLWLFVDLIVEKAEYGTVKHINLFAIRNADNSFAGALFSGLVNMNVVLFLINLFVPAYPVDCSRIFTTTLMMYGFGPQGIATFGALLGIICGILAILWGAGVAAAHYNSFILVLGILILLSSLDLAIFAFQGRADEHPLFDYKPAVGGAYNAGGTGGGQSSANGGAPGQYSSGATYGSGGYPAGNMQMAGNTNQRSQQYRATYEDEEDMDVPPSARGGNNATAYGGVASAMAYPPQGQQQQSPMQENPLYQREQLYDGATGSRNENA